MPLATTTKITPQLKEKFGHFFTVDEFFYTTFIFNSDKATGLNHLEDLKMMSSRIQPLLSL